MPAAGLHGVGLAALINLDKLDHRVARLGVELEIISRLHREVHSGKRLAAAATGEHSNREDGEERAHWIAPCSGSYCYSIFGIVMGLSLGPPALR
ncbi:hypothetical protein CSC43_4133 [Pseudomonas aeruginosa]|nr:hypothetical protein CSB94_2043 [Pseudomonas aeruginosa]AVK09685.1 hypothetical protein CSB91_4076 [Pseudomonas aeruginosa]RCH32041.1 hypothetical protein CSC43_4133 [Pseudomonas aeruginosa]